MTKNIYNLEATNYNGVPSLAWDAILKTKAEKNFKGLGPVHDDVNVHKCVKVLPLPYDNGSTLVYENQYIETPDVTVEERRPSGLTTLRVDLLFNLQLSQDIGPTNPFYLEVRYG